MNTVQNQMMRNELRVNLEVLLKESRHEKQALRKFMRPKFSQSISRFR